MLPHKRTDSFTGGQIVASFDFFRFLPSQDSAQGDFEDFRPRCPPNPAIGGSLGLHFSPPDLSFDSPPVPRYFERNRFFDPKMTHFSLSPAVSRSSRAVSPPLQIQQLEGPWAFILGRQTFPLIPHQFRDILKKSIFDPKMTHFCSLSRAISRPSRAASPRSKSSN